MNNITEREIIKKLKKLKEKNIKVEKKTEEELKLIHDRKKKWCTYWRSNINLYIAKKLDINTYSYQHFSYYIMGDSTTYFEVSTRNSAKTYKLANYGNALCMTKPYSEVAFVASTLGQAKIALDDKLLGEIFSKESMSPIMPYLYKIGLIKKVELDSGWCLEYWNGSKFYFFPSIDSIRGKRLTCLILEEVLLQKRTTIENVFKPMLRPRNAGYKSLPEYVGRRDLDEEPQTIYITSNGGHNTWWNKIYRETFVGYFKNKYARDRIFSVDIYIALKHGLKSISWFLSEQKKMSPLAWEAEILNLDIGEAEGAYFTRDMFDKNQVLKKAWIPPSAEDIKNGKNKNCPKKDNEYRFIFVDFAWVGDNDQNKNDKTVLGCASCFMKSDHLTRQIEHMETYGGERANDIPLRIKELFFDFSADYIVLDIRSSGEILFNQLSTPMEHPIRDNTQWNNHGLSISIEKDIHMVNNDKYQQLLERTVDPDPIRCIIPINASSGFNSNMWIDLNGRLRNEEISFLINELEFKTWFEEQKEWFKYTPDERANMMLPYINTELMIYEATNLSQEWKEGQLKLISPRSGTKDKIVAVAYFNMIASKLENKLIKKNQNDEFNINDWQLVF